MRIQLQLKFVKISFTNNYAVKWNSIEDPSQTSMNSKLFENLKEAKQFLFISNENNEKYLRLKYTITKNRCSDLSVKEEKGPCMWQAIVQHILTSCVH